MARLLHHDFDAGLTHRKAETIMKCEETSGMASDKERS